MPLLTGPHMDATYLIFERHTATRVSLVRAASLTDAVCAYIAERTEEDIVLQPDGSLRVIGQSYPHPLAFIEALFKVDSEWQIRRLPEWAGASHTVTEFWGEDARYPAEMIKQCRPIFRKAFPRNRAKAFVWFLEQGTLVTFYHKVKPYQIAVLARYLWSWKTGTLTITEWQGDYQQIADSLILKPYLYRSQSHPINLR